MSESITANPTLGTSIIPEQVPFYKQKKFIYLIFAFAVVLIILVSVIIYLATRPADCINCNCTTTTQYTSDQAGQSNASPGVASNKQTSDYWKKHSPFDNIQPTPIIFKIPDNAIPVSSDSTLFKTSDIIIKESNGIVITPAQNDFVQLSVGNSNNNDMNTNNFDINYDIPVIIITPNKTQITYHTIFDTLNQKSVNHFIIPTGSAFILVSPNDKAPLSSTDVYNPIPYISKIYNTPIYFKVNSSATIQSIPLPPVEAPLSYNPILTTLDMTSLTPLQVSNLDPLIIQGLNLRQITQLSNLHISALTNTQISYLTPTQLNSFSQAQIQGLTTSQIASLTLSQISILNTNFVAAIPASKFINLSIPQMIAFSNIITSSESGCVTPAQLTTMNTSLLNFISLLNTSNTNLPNSSTMTMPISSIAPTSSTIPISSIAPTSSVLDITPTPVTPTVVITPTTVVATPTPVTPTATPTTVTTAIEVETPVDNTQSITKIVASFRNNDNYTTSNFLSRSSRDYI